MQFFLYFLLEVVLVLTKKMNELELRVSKIEGTKPSGKEESAKPKEEEDDFDLFGSESEEDEKEDDEERKKLLDKYHEKKSKSKSQVFFFELSHRYGPMFTSQNVFLGASLTVNIVPKF